MITTFLGMLVILWTIFVLCIIIYDKLSQW
jgi:hypothetical protein